ncbi:MAG: YedE-related selenium metabolism membrane protein [Deltaproteobacteria bacterium]|jgi:YedE family putative selenium metabolism protein|nr:YedE-related selenium metabolism membrane protein [Deltaproteobacteria bacterium]
MQSKKNPFAATTGVIGVGAVIGILASTLQHLGNPANMGICVACFERDVAGSLGLHQAAVVQYLRPEIIGLCLGAFAAALFFGEFKSRGGSAPIQRFLLGMIAMVGALVFLGCPWRALFRLGGGDWNAAVGLAGLATGIFIGTLFFRHGFNLGSSKTQTAATGYALPLIMIGLLALRLAFPQIEGAGKSGVLFYSVSGPGAAHAPLLVSLGVALVIGFLAQRSRFCSLAAFRDIFLFGQTRLMLGVIALVAGIFAANIFYGQFHPGFAGQPIAHSNHLWNFCGMVMSGLAFALAGGCPGRQLFMSGEGDSDAAVFVMGMIVGAAFSHNFGMASSAAGPGPYGPISVAIGMFILLTIGLTNRSKA